MSPSSQQSRPKKQKSLSAWITTSFGPDEATATATAASASLSSSKYKIFCDLDGVLVDFDAGVKKMSGGQSPDDFPTPTMMWSAIGRADRFYANLPWTVDGKALWSVLRKHTPTPDILTGLSRSNKSREEKVAWCTRELGGTRHDDDDDGDDCIDLIINHVDMAGKKSAHELISGRRKNNAPGVVNVITCWSKNKHCESNRNHVLIDDRLSLRDAWEEKGGIFIHHTTTDRTLAMLREKRVLNEKVGNV
jgi:hypothetical protein